MAQVVLSSPFHDPDARLNKDLLASGEKLKQMFNNLIFVSVTSDTSKEIIDSLNKLGINYEVPQDKQIDSLGQSYRNAIKLGLSQKDAFILLLDFDRALHWVRYFPKELEKITQKLKREEGFVTFIRSKRAFDTHPQIQRETETRTNTMASQLAGTKVDIMSGAFGLDNKLAHLILEESKHDDYGIYAEIFKIASDNLFKIQKIEVEGLEWETPDQYRDEIEKEGYEKWFNGFQSQAEWKKRKEIEQDSIEVLKKSS